MPYLAAERFGQRERFAVLVEEREVGGLVTGLEHNANVASSAASPTRRVDIRRWRVREQGARALLAELESPHDDIDGP
jgi:hypothetical protein